MASLFEHVGQQHSTDLVEDMAVMDVPVCGWAKVVRGELKLRRHLRLNPLEVPLRAAGREVVTVHRHAYVLQG